MSAAAALSLRPLRGSDAADVLELLSVALSGGPPSTRPKDFLDWKHRANPFGESPGLVALHGERVVGVRLFLRWQLAVGVRQLRVVRAVDTATHPEFQRLGIFRRLTIGLLEQLEREEGLELVFNTPNAASRPGYLKMGWQEIGSLPVRISPVRPWRLAAGAAAARAATAAGSAGAAMPAGGQQQLGCDLPTAAEGLADQAAVEDLLAQIGGNHLIHTPLSVPYLRWRYVQPPGLDYRAVVATRGGALVGLGLGRLRRRAGLAEFTLGDVLVRAGDTHAARQVLRGARRAGADHVALHAPMGSEVARVATASGYLRVPRQGIGLVANPRPGCPPEVLQGTSWRLSLGDLEVF